MAKMTGYHLVETQALPVSFWQDEEKETVRFLQDLRHAGFCWVIWDQENQVLYERRDLYRCAIVPIDKYDLLDREIPGSDLFCRTFLPIFFSRSQFQKILATPPHAKSFIPPNKNARAFIIRNADDELGQEPVESVEVNVPLGAFQGVLHNAQEKALQKGKSVVVLRPALLYLKAALLTLQQKIAREVNLIYRHELVRQQKQLLQMHHIRAQWRHKHYVTIEPGIQQETYVVRVGLHPTLYREAA